MADVDIKRRASIDRQGTFGKPALAPDLVFTGSSFRTPRLNGDLIDAIGDGECLDGTREIKDHLPRWAIVNTDPGTAGRCVATRCFIRDLGELAIRYRVAGIVGTGVVIVAHNIGSRRALTTAARVSVGADVIVRAGRSIIRENTACLRRTRIVGAAVAIAAHHGIPSSAHAIEAGIVLRACISIIAFGVRLREHAPLARLA